MGFFWSALNVTDQRFVQSASRFYMDPLPGGHSGKIPTILPSSWMCAICFLLLPITWGRSIVERDADAATVNKHNANFGNHAIWIHFNHTDFPKTWHVLSFDRRLYLCVSYVHHVEDSQSIIQAGPCLYWSKAKLLCCAECSVNDPSDMPMSVYHVPQAERPCGLSAWRRHWIHGTSALNETTASGRRHAPVRRTITQYILYATTVTRAVSQCLLR